jgi:rhamnose transport system permease protein
MRRYRREIWVAVVLVAVLHALAIAPAFQTGDIHWFYEDPEQLRNLLVAAAPILVAAIGMTMVILSRHIDISIGAQFSICAVTVGLAATAGLPMWQVAVLGVLSGAALGAVNGALVVGLELPSIVVTLATLVIGRESLNWCRGGEFVSNLPGRFQWFGTGQDLGQWLIVGSAAAVFVAFALCLTYTAVGRAVYAVGSNEEAARLAGIRPRRVVFGVFVLLGALTGLAALLNSVRLAAIDPHTGAGLEMRVIAAVVVGGTAISGGRGSLIGTLIGVALLSVIVPALIYLHVRTEWEKAIEGIIILLAVASDATRRRS